jgi:hypothetical protein
VNEIGDTQGVELGTYQDAAPLTSTATNKESLQDPYKTNNMETFDLNRVIQREYAMAPITWTTASASGTLLATYNFPDALFQIPFIQQKINDFRYFRSAVRMTFRMTTTRFLYGKLMVAFQPTPQLTPFPPTSVFNWSSYPHILISASAGESAVLDIPYVSQNRGLDLENFLTNEMASIKVYVLNPLTDVMGEPANAQVFVTAQFIDAELWLPHDQGTLPGMAMVETQSSRAHIRRRVEADKKSTLGTVSDKLEDMSAMTSAIKSVSSKSVSDNLYDMATTAGVAMLMAGLSKPTTTDFTSVTRINPYADVANSKGIDLCSKLAMDPQNEISTLPNVGGITEDEMELNYVVGIPVLVAAPAFVAGTPATQIATTSPFDNSMTLVDFVSRNFLYRSGSLKFKIYITASQFHAVRMVFYLSDAGDTVNSDWQQCYHRVVDIQGDTEVEIMTPYCSNQVCQGQTDNTEFGLWCQILSWSQPDNTISSPIYLNVYKAADSDMQFGVLIQKEYVVTSVRGNLLRPRVELQSNPRADFRKPFQPIQESISAYDHTGYVWGERYTTLREIVHRYQPCESLVAGQPALVYYANGSPSAAKTYYGVEMWGLLYNYWRGSMRIKMLQKTYTATGVGYYKTPTYFPAGLVLSSSVNPYLDGEFPYYRPTLFSPTTSSTASDGYSFVTDSLVARYPLKAAGDDFSFHFIHLPPTGSLNDIGATHGNRGLVTWLST